MAENSDGQEKTEDATPKKEQEARKKGQIPRSKDLGTMFVLIGSAVGILVSGPMLADAMMGMMKRVFSLTRQEATDPHALFHAIMESINYLMAPLLIFFFIVLVAAFFGNIMLGGINFSGEAMMPKFNKLNPMSGFKRMFGIKALVELVKTILKFSVVAVVALILLYVLFEEILALSMEAIPLNFKHSMEMLSWMFLILSCSLIIIAVIDAVYQVWNHKNELMMTKQEVKDEMKNSEGSPEIKSRIRRTQYEMSQRRMMEDVPNADVVITNPTHYSVALKYDANVGGAPMVVAKGVDEMAMHIRTIAKEHGVEIIASPMLARSLYYTCDVNEDIPEELFAAVAQVLAFIFQLREHKKGRAHRPKEVSKDLPIPDEFKY